MTGDALRDRVSFAGLSPTGIKCMSGMQVRNSKYSQKADLSVFILEKQLNRMESRK